MRRLVRAIVANATVTGTTTGPARIDPIVLRAANILPLEEIEIVHELTHERLSTWTVAAEEGSGEVAIPRFRAGDRITIVSWGLLHDGQTLAHRALLVTLGSGNEVVSIEN